MERQLTDPNQEEDHCEKDSWLYLTCVVDLEGFHLFTGADLYIPDTALLSWVYNDDRGPDSQRGREYWSNQYAEIDQTFRDSVSTVDSQIAIYLTCSTTGFDSCPQMPHQIILGWQRRFARTLSTINRKAQAMS